MEEVKESLEGLSFVIELIDLTDEDIKINSFAFLWPKRIDPLFDEARLKLLTNQEKAVAKVYWITCLITELVYSIFLTGE